MMVWTFNIRSILRALADCTSSHRPSSNSVHRMVCAPGTVEIYVDREIFVNMGDPQSLRRFRNLVRDTSCTSVCAAPSSSTRPLTREQGARVCRTRLPTHREFDRNHQQLVLRNSVRSVSLRRKRSNVSIRVLNSFPKNERTEDRFFVHRIPIPSSNTERMNLVHPRNRHCLRFLKTC